MEGKSQKSEKLLHYPNGEPIEGEVDQNHLNNSSDQIESNQGSKANEAIAIYNEEDPDDQEINNNPYILSSSAALPKHSFIDSRQKYDPKCPPPVYLSEEIIQERLPTHHSEILKGFDKPAKGGLVWVDQEGLAKQNGVLVEVLRQLTVNLMKGLSISHISLPIKIFEPRSSIHRIVDLWSYAPIYLKEAAKTKDHLERFKLCIAFSLAGIYLCTSQDKPFNPLLGETLQAQFSDGTKIYCEHTSHHPPITHFLIEAPDQSFKYYGYYEFTGKMGANNLKSGLRGPNNIVFADGQHIRFRVADWKLGGTVYGERGVEADGNTFFEDLTNNRKACIIFSTYKKSGFFKKKESGCKDEYHGLVYNCTPILNHGASAKQLFSKQAIEVKEFKDLKDVVKPICELQGSWLRQLTINKQEYWNIDSNIPERCLPELDVLPSDWRYREDLIWLKYKYQKIAQKWKIRLEEQQRLDRRNRQNAEKERLK